MSNDPYVDLPEILTLSEGINLLSQMDAEQQLIHEVVVQNYKRSPHPVHFALSAALRRSAALIPAFLQMVDQRNEFAALPFIRLQLDTVLRVSAIRLIDNPGAMVIHMLEGKELKKFDQTQKPKGSRLELTDAGLRENLEEKYEFISEIYKDKSGYVHFSQHHLIRSLENWDKTDVPDDADYQLGVINELSPWSEEERRNALVEFCTATKYLMEEVKDLLAIDLPPYNPPAVE